MPTPPEFDPACSRLAFLLINDFTIWNLGRLRQKFDGDLDAALILGEIGHFNINLAELLRQDLGRWPDLLATDQRYGQGPLRVCNAFSISEATGIPRETVRRKVLWLMEKGWLAKDERGGLAVLPETADFFEDFNRETLDKFLELCDRLRALRQPGGKVDAAGS